MKRYLARLFLVGASILLTLFALEIYVRQAELLDREASYKRRLFQVSKNPELVYEFRPNFETSFGRKNPVTFKINSLGLRDRETSRKRPMGIYRIIVLGDSATAGFGLEVEETFPKQLERLLNGPQGPRGYEVLNCAVNGYNIFNVRAYLESKGLALEPNLVILAYNLNDYKEQYGLNNLGVLLRTEDYVDSYYSLVNLSELYLLLRVKYLELKKQYFPSKKKRAPFRDWRWRVKEDQEFYANGGGERWAQVKANLLRMSSLAHRNGASFLVVILPERYQLNGDESSIAVPQEKVKRHLEHHGIPYLDLLPAFRANGESSPGALFIDFNHPSARGHALVAKELYRYLQARQPLLDHPVRKSTTQAEVE